MEEGRPRQGCLGKASAEDQGTSGAVGPAAAVAVMIRRSRGMTILKIYIYKVL